MLNVRFNVGTNFHLMPRISWGLFHTERKEIRLRASHSTDKAVCYNNYIHTKGNKVNMDQVPYIC